MGSVIKVKASTLVVLNVPPSVDYTNGNPYAVDEEDDKQNQELSFDELDEAEEEKIDILNNYTTQARRSMVKSQSAHQNVNSQTQPHIPRYSSFNMRHNRTSSTSQYHLPRHTRIYNQPLPSRRLVYPPQTESILPSNLRV